MNPDKQPADYRAKWHDGWWCIARIIDDLEEILPGPHFDNQNDAIFTARYLAQQKARRMQAAGATKDRKLQPGE
jgi:hypothetical protein